MLFKTMRPNDITEREKTERKVHEESPGVLQEVELRKVRRNQQRRQKQQPMRKTRGYIHDLDVL